MPTFRTVLRKPEAMDAMGIEVPPSIVEALGQGKRPKVVVTLKGYSYRSTVAVMDGKFLLPLAKAHRAKIAVEDGETVSVQLDLDTAPREVAVPGDLAAALEAAGVREAFDAQAYTHRKEHVRAVEEAKKPETRVKRIQKVVEMLQAKA